MSPRGIILTVLMLCLSSLYICSGHNITKILAKHPEFSTFNHLLSLTRLATEINRRATITVCALDNDAAAPIAALNPATARNVLAFHVLLDYFGAKKLHQITDGTALAATMFQATGTARGSSGFVNITDLNNGRVAFAPEDNAGDFPARFLKSVEEIPYNISVIQISSVIASDEASAPVPEAPPINLTSALSSKCKLFTAALIASPAALAVYNDNLAGGLTVFCPNDKAFTDFADKFKNLTVAGKASLLEIHAVPTFNSLQMLRSSNGEMNTLATSGGGPSSRFGITVQNDGDDVTIKTRLTTATIVEKVQEEDPLGIYVLDEVLKPRELFKGDKAEVEAEVPAPAPAPAKKKAKKKGKVAAAPAGEDDEGESPADSPEDEDAADATADDNAGNSVRGFGFGLGVGVSVLLGFLIV